MEVKLYKNKIMKKFITLILFFGFLSVQAFAGILEECYKIYPVDADNLFMASLNVLGSNNKFEISEIQTKNGYILFSVGSKYYLLTVTKRYKNQSEVKVLPQNSDYSQGSIVATTIFNMLNEEIKRPMELVK